MKLVAGLGNPGPEYERTPHNVGFAVADELARRGEAEFRRSLRFRVRAARVKVADEPVWLVEPQTFMNASGPAVGAMLRYHRMTPADLIVVVDDADLPLGDLRIRKQGGDGGHRGLRSIIDALGTGEFLRVRIGIGRGAGREENPLVAHVLSAFSPAEWKAFGPRIAAAADAVACAIAQGADEAMNRFNRRSKEDGAMEAPGPGGGN